MDEKQRILDLVKEGKLTAEEAIVLFENLAEGKSAGSGGKSTEEEIVHELSTQVKFDESSYGQEHSTKESSTKTKFVDFIDSALKKIKDLDLDFNFGQAFEVNHIFQHSNVTINQVELDIANGSIDMIPWNEGDVRVECEAKVYKSENTDQARRAFLEDVLFSIEDGKLRFTIQKKHMKVKAKVYIPRTDYEYIMVRMFNGPIIGEGLTVKEFKAKTANGSIKVNGLSSSRIELEAANGHISVKDTQSKDCEVETINGTVQVFGRHEKVDAQSFNGNIICKLYTDDCHTIHAKTTTGNIDIYTPETNAIDGELKSNLGGFKCDLPHMDIIEEKSEVVQKYLRFKTNPEGGKRLSIFAESKTGSVLINQNQ